MWTSERFDRTRRLALDLAGIALFERHRELLERRQRRVGLDGAAYDALIGDAESGDPAAKERLIGLLTTRFTGFFRHPWHFEIAAEHALWSAHRRGSARLWSAGAATGEEPWSLAMAVLEVFRGGEPPVSIVATDVDAAALAAARRGVYGETALQGVSEERRARFFGGPDGSGRRTIADAVRRLVDFRESNLADAEPLAGAPFDVVFCRNALMYLEESRRERAVERLASLIRSGGLLVLDPAEHLGRGSRWFGEGRRGVYLRSRKP